MVRCEVDGQTTGTVMFTVADEGAEQYHAREIGQLPLEEVQGVTFVNTQYA